MRKITLSFFILCMLGLFKISAQGHNIVPDYTIISSCPPGSVLLTNASFIDDSLYNGVVDWSWEIYGAGMFMFPDPDSIVLDSLPPGYYDVYLYAYDTNSSMLGSYGYTSFSIDDGHYTYIDAYPYTFCDGDSIIISNTSYSNTSCYSGAVNYSWFIDSSNVWNINTTAPLSLGMLPYGNHEVTLESFDTLGNPLGKTSDYFYVSGGAYVEFSFYVNKSCAPGEIEAYNYSYGDCYTGTINYMWFLNGMFVTDTFDLFVDTLPGGHYNLRLEAYDSVGAPLGFYEDQFDIQQWPKDIIFSSGNQACPGENVTFSLPVPDEEISWVEWTFDNDSSNIDYSYHPERKYYEEKVISVKAIVEYYSCGSDTIYKNLIVSANAIPKPKIHAPMEACPGDMIHFNTDGDYTFYEWDFGGGNIVNNPYADFTFATVGMHPVILTVENMCGNVGSDTVIVNVSDSLFSEIYVDFSWWWQGSDCANSPIQFESYSSGGMHKWYFGDGDSATTRNVMHTYAAPGEYNVTLVVSNSCGNSASQETTVSVIDRSGEMLYDTPYFMFDIDNDDGEEPDTLFICPDEEVRFRNHSGGWYGLSYLWEFGDSTSSTLFEPVKIYSVEGTYQVTLWLKDECGRTSSPATKWVVVSSTIMPMADLGVLPMQICPGEEVYYFDDDFEPSKNYTYNIDFGDGQSLTNVSQLTNMEFYTLAIHKYDSIGNYNYVFTVTNSCGNTDTITDIIEVTTNLTDKPFVYVENSTNREDNKITEIWDQQSPDSSRFRLEIPMNWSSWDSATMNNTFFVYFWFGGVDLKGDPGTPDGMVQFMSNTITIGDTVVAYIPYGPRGNSVGVVAAWYCDPMNIDMQEEPESYTLPIHYDGYPIDEIPITKGGSGSVSDYTLGMPIMLPTWDGICNKDRLEGRYLFSDMGTGSMIRVDFWDDEQNGPGYALGYVDHPFGDYYYMIDQGTYYSITLDSIQLSSDGNASCGTSSYGMYKVVKSGDSLQFINGMDNCSARQDLLSGRIYMNIGNDHHEDLSGCPGDPVKFKAAGGTSWTWNFGDGSAQMPGQIVQHTYQDTGTYNAFVIVTTACGGIDTVFNKVRIGYSNIPRVDFDVNPYTSFAGDTVYFKYYDKDEFANESLIWNFGDGSTSNMRDAKHTYQWGGYYDVFLTAYNGCGANTGWRSLEVIGEQNPCSLYADFYYEDYGDTVRFFDYSSYEFPPHRWQWAFGDGAFSDKVSPKHVYNQPGRYTVCLTITDTISGCSHKSCYEVQVGTFNCYTSFEFNVDNDANKVAFVDSSLNVQEWFWDFGDGKYSYEKNPVHQYTEPGYYFVCLTTTSVDGCVSSWCEYVQVGNTTFCFADLFAAPEDGLKYSFWSEGNFEPNLYYWDFGDGEVSKLKTPVHEYKKAGVYVVCLIVENDSTGCISEICKEIKVGTIDCFADYQFFVKSDTVEFIAKLDTTKVFDVYWDFGDNTYSTKKNPIHKYLKSGVYGVCLAIKDSISGCYAEVCKEIYVGTVDCKAEFSFVKDNTTNTLKITDKSSGTISRWYWSFGDGKSSNVKNPTYTYAKAGKYVVCLDIFNDTTGCYSSICKEIQIGVVDSVNCYFDFTHVISGNKVDLIGNSNTTISKVYWEFGDGSYDYGEKISHTYDKAGVYKICGNMSSASGCQVNICKEIQVGEVDCKATFTYVVDHATKNVKVINQSVGEFAKWYWDMGDNKSMYGLEGSHTYDKYGKYKVCCIGTNDVNECYSQICKEIEIIDSTKQLCSTSFSAVKTEGSREVKFADNSPVKYSKWYWTFGDGYIESLKAPTHTYAKDGVYKVCLFGYSDSLKCGVEICKDVTVSSSSTPTKLLKAEFSHVVDSAGLGVAFKDLSTGSPTSWYWTYGDGTYAKGQTPGKKTYSKAGVYKVCLVIYSSATGQSSEYCAEVIVGTKQCNVIASFSSFVDVDTRETKFTDGSKGSVNKWFWNFGDGTSSSKQNPVHTYSKAGFYLVSLAISDTVNGCVDYFADFIQAGSVDCKADFDYVIDSLEVDFTNTSKGSLERVYWNFDDGSYSIEKEPLHTYAKPGVYLVTLSVADSSGTCSDIVRKQIQVGNVDCSAGFTVIPDSTNNSAYFEKDALGSVTNNFWVFGDGGFSRQESPSHKYGFPGYYTAALNTFYQLTNCIDYHEEVVLIGSQGSDCEADFFYTTNGKAVSFGNKSLGEGLTFKWFFGTGDTSVVEEPTYTYLNGGFYNVCLTVKNSSNITNTTCKVVRVDPDDKDNCLAKFDYTVDSTTRNVIFTDNSIGDPDAWSWSFGDGSASTDQNPEHAYTSNDYYLVKFRIANSITGCKSRTYAYIPVSVASSDYIKGAFGYEKDTTGTKGSGEPVDFIGVATGKPAKYEWDFGDGSSTSATSSPTHTYTESGTYEVCMTISDPVTGQSDVTCEDVVIDLGEDTLSVSNISFISGEVKIYPNPFADHTVIDYDLRNTTMLTITVYDALGKEVEILASTTKAAGSHKLIWNTDYLESGIYMLEFRDNAGYAKTMMVVKK